MASHSMAMMTQRGMTPRQPRAITSFRTNGGESGYILNVFRVYDGLLNAVGGLGRMKPCDGDGRKFPDLKTARAFTLSYGYTCHYRRRSVPHQAYQAAQRHLDRFGEYTGRRKLTRYLVNRLEKHGSHGVLYGITWNGKL